MMECIPEGFKAMVPAIMILTFAWSLKAMTDSLGSTEFVETFVKTYAENFAFFLPAIVFLIGCFLAFATGTSWGTFGILIPITMAIFPLEDPLGIICISACMARRGVRRPLLPHLRHHYHGLLLALSATM